MSLEEKTVIVTGAASGIGRASAELLAARGARVVLADVNAALGTELESQIVAAGQVASFRETDLTSREQVRDLVSSTLDAYGSLDVLVHAAAIAVHRPFLELDDELWHRTLDVCLTAAFYINQEVAKVMVERGGGRIINVTNLGGRTPGPDSMPTSISRAAGIAITKGLSKDLAQDNILVSTVCIGLVKSGQHERRYEARKQSEPGLTEDAFYDELAQRRAVPLGRVAEAEEAGDVIAFLASARASYLTGIAVNIDGGASAVV